MSNTEIRGPYWDKHRRRWAVRWTDAEGKRRRRAIWAKDQKKEADEFRRGLTGQPPEQGAGAEPVPDPPKAKAGSAEWYLLILQGLTARVARDPGDRDAQAALRAVAQAAAASNPLRDLQELEATLKDLQARYDELTKARKHGAAVVAPQSRKGAEGEMVRRDDAIC